MLVCISLILESVLIFSEAKGLTPSAPCRYIQLPSRTLVFVDNDEWSPGNRQLYVVPLATSEKVFVWLYRNLN